MPKYQKVFFTTIALGLMATTAGAANLLDYWTFDETSGTTLGNQVTGRPGVSMGNFTGTEWTTNVPTVLTHSTGALSFDPVQQQYLALQPRTGYNGDTEEFSMSFWIKPAGNAGSDMRFFSQKDFITFDDLYTCLRLNMDANQLENYTYTPHNWSVVATITPDVWQNVILTCRNNTLTAYIDGNFAGTQANCKLDYTSLNQELLIGGQLRLAFGTSYSGLMDDISVWDKALKPWDAEALSDGMDPTTFVSENNVPTYDFPDYSEIVNVNFVSDAGAAAYVGTSAIPGAGTTWNAAIIDAPSDVAGEAGVNLVNALDDSGTASGISIYFSGVQNVCDYGQEATTGELYRSGLQAGTTAMNEWQVDGLVVGQTYDLVIYHEGIFAATFTSGVAPESAGIVSEWTGLTSSEGPISAAEEIWAEGYNYSVITITPTASTVTGSLCSDWNLLGMQIALHEDKIPGDANLDGFVDGSDATILANYWQYGVGMTNPDATWAMGDFNGDHIVDGSDATLLASHWQEGTPPSSAVPEPSTIVGLFTLLLLGLVRWAHKAKKITLMLLIALAMLSMTSNASAALRNYWNFEEGDYSSEYVYDVAGTHTGTLEGFLGDEWEPDVPTALTHSTNSLQFKQVNDAWVNLGNLGITTKSEAASPVDAMTLSMWIKPTSFDIENRLWSVGASDLYGEDRSSTMLRVLESKACVQYFGPSPLMPFTDETYETAPQLLEWQNTTPENSIQVNQWHHLTMVWNEGKTITTYLNGELVGHYRGPNADVDHDGFETLLGGKFYYENYGYFGNSFDGYIDDVAIWDHALSPEAVAELTGGTAPNVLNDIWAGETLPTYSEVVNVDFKFGFLPQYAGQGANPQAGTVWNEPVVSGLRNAVGASQTNLVDSSGAATTIDVSVSGFRSGFAAPTDDDYWKEANSLLDDRLVASVDTDNLWSIDGLEVGETYDIFFYGQGECDIELTAGAVADSTSLDLEYGLRILGITDDTPEDWDESITYAILTVTPTASTISGSILPSAEGVDYMGLAGMQICKHASVPPSMTNTAVPEPATWCCLISLLVGGLFLRRRTNH